MITAGILTQRQICCSYLITVAGQRRILTELSPLPLIAAPYQNRYYIPTEDTIVMGDRHFEFWLYQ